MEDIQPQNSLSSLEQSVAVLRPHHQELRKRLTIVLLAICLFSGAAYMFIEQLAAICVHPLLKASPLIHKLIYTNLPEAFITYLKLAGIVGLLASYPVILYQLWAFMAPGLKSNEKRIAFSVMFWGSFLFAGGSSFAFLVVLPKMLSYLMSFAHEGLEPLPKFGLYLTFVARTVFTFGLAFQIPFLVVMSIRSGIMRTEKFQQNRIYFYAAIITLSFLLAAGDFMATALLALPLFFLYEAGIYLSRFFGKKAPTTSEE